MSFNFNKLFLLNKLCVCHVNRFVNCSDRFLLQNLEFIYPRRICIWAKLRHSTVNVGELVSNTRFVIYRLTKIAVIYAFNLLFVITHAYMPAILDAYIVNMK